VLETVGFRVAALPGLETGEHIVVSVAKIVGRNDWGAPPLGTVMLNVSLVCEPGIVAAVATKETPDWVLLVKTTLLKVAIPATAFTVWEM
jgi:hypothetical protein